MIGIVWTEFQKVDCDKSGIHGERNICWISAETSDSCQEHSPLLVILKRTEEKSNHLMIFKAKSCEKLNGLNCLSLCTCSADTSINFESNVLASFVTQETLVRLDKIILKCSVDQNTIGDEEKCWKILVSIQTWIRKETHVACVEGQTLAMPEGNVEVVSTEPAGCGLWNGETEIEVEFTEDKPERKLPADFRTIQSLISFSGSLMFSHTKHSDQYAAVMSDNIKEWTNKLFQFEMQEIPSTLVSILIKDVRNFPKRENLFSSGVVVMNPCHKFVPNKAVQVIKDYMYIYQ